MPIISSFRDELDAISPKNSDQYRLRPSSCPATSTDRRMYSVCNPSTDYWSLDMTKVLRAAGIETEPEPEPEPELAHQSHRRYLNKGSQKYF